MPANFFLDTNVLVYAIESGGPNAAKSAAALALVQSPDAVVSTQVLGEFYRATTSVRRATPLTHAQATQWIEFWKTLQVTPITLPVVERALEVTGRYGINYYDALIVAAAEAAGCVKLVSEDLNDGQQYGTIVVQNPFQTSP